MTLESTDVLIIGAGPAGRRRRGLPAPARTPRAGARARAVPALLDRREPAAAEHGVHPGRGHAAGRRRGRLPAQERRGLRVGRQVHRRSTSATSSRHGWGTTYQVQRATFDKVLADAAARHGRGDPLSARGHRDRPRRRQAARVRRATPMAGRHRGRGALRARRQRLRPHAAAAAQAGDAVELPGARRDLHARGRPHPDRRQSVRPPARSA